MVPGEGPERLAEVIKQLRAEDGRFHMEGGSWTNNRSWVRGYDTVLVPMERASSLFHERITASGIPSSEPRYRHALFHLLSAETSCYRYWGAGMWTDYGSELCRRGSRDRHRRPVASRGAPAMANVSFALVLNVHQPCADYVVSLLEHDERTGRTEGL